MSRCFVITPFPSPARSAHVEALLAKVIEPGLRDAGLESFRPDRKTRPGNIMQQIVRGIVDADLAVANVTGNNPNVCYEVALRHATNRPLILVAEQGSEPCFDMSGQQIIYVDLADDASVSKARQELERQANETAAEQQSVITPLAGLVGRGLRPMSGIIDHGHLIEFSKIGTWLSRALARFDGSVDIFNIELNTLEQPELWKRLVAAPGVQRVRIFLPVWIFKRLERHLAKPLGRKLADVFATPEDATGRPKVEFTPVEIPESRRAFAYARFRPTVATSSPVCLMFLKDEPFSSPSKEEHYGEGERWSYRYFLRSESTRLDGFLEQCVDGAPDCSFVAGELRKLASTGFSLDEARQIHSLDERETDLCGRLIVAAAKDLSKPGNLVQNPAVSGLPKRGTTESCTLELAAATGACKLRIGKRSPSKPILLWMPPWREAWRAKVKSIDQRLSSFVNVCHLEYSERTARYTFSLAYSEARKAINQLRLRARDLGFRDTRILLAGVSVNAYLALEVAAQRDSGVSALALLAPAIDLMDAVDSFRPRTLLYSRRVCLGKPSFRRFEDQLEHFGVAIEPWYLVDLMYRGIARCGHSYFTKNLKHVAADRQVFVGSSPQDTMTAHAGVRRICDGKQNVRHRELAWSHDVSGATGFTPSAEAGSGVDDLIDFVEGFAGASASLKCGQTDEP